MNTPMTTTYTPGKLLLSIVGRGQGETLAAVAKSAGARGGTILRGHGSVDNRILRLLGLDATDLEVVLTLLAPDETPPVREALKIDPRVRKMAGGVAVELDVAGILRHVPLTAPSTQPHDSSASEATTMSANATHELISVIVNIGFAEEVMEAARKAGAGGGTIINARGTGREEDVKFFGISIVPEKEFLLILSTKEQAPVILEAVRSASCLQKPGAGIAFCMDVERFMALGAIGK